MGSPRSLSGVLVTSPCAPCPQSWHGCRRRSWPPAPGCGRLKQSWARGAGSSAGWRRSSASTRRASGSCGTSGWLCRRTTTGKVWGRRGWAACGWLQTHVAPFCRLQHTVTLLQQQGDEHRLLLQALRTELHVYQSLPGPAAEPRAGTGPVHSSPSLGCLSQPCHGSRRVTVAPLAARREGRPPAAPGREPQSVASCSRLLPIPSGAGCWHQLSSFLPATL